MGWRVGGSKDRNKEYKKKKKGRNIGRERQETEYPHPDTSYWNNSKLKIKIYYIKKPENVILTGDYNIIINKEYLFNYTWNIYENWPCTRS